jgi:hypothetical protein
MHEHIHKIQHNLRITSTPFLVAFTVGTYGDIPPLMSDANLSQNIEFALSSTRYSDVRSVPNGSGTWIQGLTSSMIPAE